MPHSWHISSSAHLGMGDPRPASKLSIHAVKSSSLVSMFRNEGITLSLNEAFELPLTNEPWLPLSDISEDWNCCLFWASYFLKVDPETVVMTWEIAAELFISGIMVRHITVTVSIHIVSMGCITSATFLLIFWRMMSSLRLISKTRPVKRVITAIIVSLYGKIAPTMWMDIRNSNILAMQTALWLTWVLKPYISSLWQVFVAKMPLQLFHYLSILGLLCVKLGSPTLEQHAQIFFRNIVHEILILAKVLIFEFKFCPVWLPR